MKTILRSMQRKNSGISREILPVFEDIITKYEAKGTPSLGHQCDKEFAEAMESHLTTEQRFEIYAKHGACKGTSHDGDRKDFAQAHAHLELKDRIALYNPNALIVEPNLIVMEFSCSHGYYRIMRNKGIDIPLPPLKPYFERCAGGRLYELEKALGIKLKIKSVDVSSLEENIDNPVVFTFEIFSDTSETFHF